MWSDSLVKYWRSYVPPCRPSRYELDLCKCELDNIKVRNRSSQPEILILGSTNEYRDLAFEERCSTSIIDNSEAFHLAISNDRRYKNSTEKVYFKSWENMRFNEKFDLIVGDLVIGNVSHTLSKQFLSNVSNALKPGGVFLTKSFFYDPARLSENILLNAFKFFEENYPYDDPYPHLAYPLTVAAMDPKTYILEFGKMYQLLEKALEEGLISERTLERYKELGWHDGSKIEFYVMPLALWEEYLRKIFSSFSVSYAPYTWAKDFPFYRVLK